MMADYVAAWGLRVQLNKILNVANKHITDLPTIPDYVNNGRPFVCWAHILGRCRFPNCAFKNEHVPCSSIPDAFAEEVVTILTPGVKQCARAREQEGLPGKQQRADHQNRHMAAPAAKKARTGTGNGYKTTVGRGYTRSKIDSNELHQIKKAKVTFDNELLKYKPTRGANKIIQGHIPSASRATTAPTALRIINDESPGWVTGNGWILPRELLDGGQGKLSSGMDISSSSSDNKYPPAPSTTTMTMTEHAAYELLRPPIIKSTGEIATGATTKTLQKQNKAEHNKKLLQ
jgi:hypothetical protein